MSKAIRNLLLIAAVLIIAGGIIAGIGFASGGMKPVGFGLGGPYIVNADNGEYVEVNESYSNITELRINIDFGEIKLVEGSSFSLTGRYYTRYQTLEISERNGVLTISGKPFQRNWWSLGWWGFDFGSPFEEELTFTYPKGTVFNSIDISNSLGSLDIQRLSAQSLRVSLDAGNLNGTSISVESLNARLSLGNCTIRDLTVTRNATINMDAGALNLRDVSIHDLTVKNSLGDVTFSGFLTGQARISLAAGSLRMDLTNTLATTSYAINTDLGSITLNGQRHGTSARATVPSPTCSLDIKVSLGGVELNTR